MFYFTFLKILEKSSGILASASLIKSSEMPYNASHTEATIERLVSVSPPISKVSLTASLKEVL